MGNPVSVIDFNDSLAVFLATAVSDGTYDDLLTTLKFDKVGEEAQATDIDAAAGQLWSNVVDDYIKATYPSHYRATKTWRVADNAERDALGSDDGLAVDDIGYTEDTNDLFFVVSVDGAASSTWAAISSAAETLAATLAAGNTTDGTELTVTGGFTGVTFATTSTTINDVLSPFTIANADAGGITLDTSGGAGAIVLDAGAEVRVVNMLHVNNAAGAASTLRDDLVIGETGGGGTNFGGTIFAGITGTAGWAFGDDTDSDVGHFQYQFTGDQFVWSMGAAASMVARNQGGSTFLSPFSNGQLDLGQPAVRWDALNVLSASVGDGTAAATATINALGGATRTFLDMQFAGTRQWSLRSTSGGTLLFTDTAGGNPLSVGQSNNVDIIGTLDVTGTLTAGDGTAGALVAINGAGSQSDISLQDTGVNGWIISYPHGSNAFEINRRDPGTGANVDNPFVIASATGVVTVLQRLEANDRIEVGGTASFGVTNPGVFVGANNGAFRGASVVTDATNKTARYQGSHYTNAEQPTSAILVTSTAGSTVVNVGGSSSLENAATSVSLYTAINNTTTTGTERLRVDAIGDVLILGGDLGNVSNLVAKGWFDDVSIGNLGQDGLLTLDKILTGPGRFDLLSGGVASWRLEHEATGEDAVWQRGAGFTDVLRMAQATGRVTIAEDLEMGASGPRVITGTGTPEAAVTAPIGSTFMRDDGGAGTSFYVKESGVGNTGWVAK